MALHPLTHSISAIDATIKGTLLAETRRFELLKALTPYLVSSE